MVSSLKKLFAVDSYLHATLCKETSDTRQDDKERTSGNKILVWPLTVKENGACLSPYTRSFDFCT